MGELIPIKVSTFGFGGAVSIKYNCSGYGKYEAHFERMSSTIRVTVCQYKWHSLWLDAPTPPITRMHCVLMLFNGPPFSQPSNMFPVVQDMFDRMCEEAKIEMKTINQDELVSWSRAVTYADGARITRGKNFTFGIHNYYTGALLYQKHLCQKGRDTLTNKGALPGELKDMLHASPSRKQMKKA